MKTIYKLAIVLDGTKVLNINFITEPKKGVSFDVVGYNTITLKEVCYVNSYNDGEKETKHYTCIGTTQSNLVGVRQVKFIRGNDYDDMERKLNEFLNETKFTHTIEDITHAMAYIAVQYKLKNERDIWSAKNFLKTYQEL